jgi:hypothetical protein
MIGVRTVLTNAVLRPLLTSGRIGLPQHSGYLRSYVDPFPLVKEEATHVGEPITIVVADSRRGGGIFPPPG